MFKSPLNSPAHSDTNMGHYLRVLHPPSPCACVHHCPCVSGLTRSWKMYRLFVAAMAMIFSNGCHAMCRIFLVKSKLSTPTSPRRRLPPVYTLRVRSTARGLLLSRQASSVTPRPVSLSNILKKLLYAPVMMTLRRDKNKRASDWE